MEPPKDNGPEGGDGGGEGESGSFCECLSGCPRLAEGRESEFRAGGQWLVLILFGSIVAQIKADRLCFGFETEYLDDELDVDVCGGYGVYAIVTTAISIVISFYALLTPKFRLPWGKVEMKHAAAFLAGFWSINVCIYTFKSPFLTVGNGYFGSWLATFASISLLARYVPNVGAALSASIAEDVGKLLCLSSVCCVSCIFVCTTDYGGGTSCVNESAWALTCSAVSVLTCAILISAKDKVPIDKISVFLAIWWTFGTGVMTFRSPFVYVGNGWISAWGSLVIACKLMAAQLGFEPEVVKPASVQDSFRWFPQPDEKPKSNVPAALQPSTTAEEPDTPKENPFNADDNNTNFA